jgi:pyridoxal phosphate enzyme (YggS family)
VAAGVRNVGENRVQEAREKRAALAELSAVWHLVGHLQRNKAREAVGLFDLIQSLDSAELAAEIDRRARAAGKVQEVLVEVNSSGQESKFGVSPEATVDFIAPLGSLRGIRVRGLMTVGPWPSTPPETRKAFRRLRDLRDRIAALNLAGISMDYLSMGMTQDFETALEEGSNMVRIGTAIFGERDGA